MTDDHKKATAPAGDRAPPTAAEMKSRIELSIHRLHVRSRQGLWGLLAFVLISLGAMRNFDFIPAFSDEVWAVLGKPPSAGLISLALVLYAFSALILILARMTSGSEKYKGWSHLGYLSGFYIFYYLSDALQDNFWAIFAAGLTILGLEYYHIWNLCNEKIRKEKENLARIKRCADFY